MTIFSDIVTFSAGEQTTLGPWQVPSDFSDLDLEVLLAADTLLNPAPAGSIDIEVSSDGGATWKENGGSSWTVADTSGLAQPMSKVSTHWFSEMHTSAEGLANAMLRVRVELSLTETINALVQSQTF